MPLRRLFLFLLALTVLPAFGQSYPTKPVRLVSPFPPGGSVDVVGRLIAAKLTENIGQQVIVDNRSGASGNIGMEHVARAAPDGYTLVINTLPLVANQFLLTRVPYDPVRDFAPISHVTLRQDHARKAHSWPVPAHLGRSHGGRHRSAPA